MLNFTYIIYLIQHITFIYLPNLREYIKEVIKGYKRPLQGSALRLNDI